MSESDPVKFLYSVEEVMESLGIGRVLLYRLFRSGRLKSSLIGTRRFCTVRQLEAFVHNLEEGDVEL